MGRPKDSTFRDTVTTEYDRQVRERGCATYATVRAAIGGNYQYISALIKTHRELTEQKGQLRECLCCDDHFISTGKHHRLCDKCRFAGEYCRPYAISPSIIHVGREF
jgi:hypothetical protein